MQTERLGKITNASFGRIEDAPYLMGLEVELEDENGLTAQNIIAINIGLYEKLNQKEKEEYLECIWTIDRILEKAGVNKVRELIGKPVKIITKNQKLKGWRILTEVL